MDLGKQRFASSVTIDDHHELQTHLADSRELWFMWYLVGIVRHDLRCIPYSVKPQRNLTSLYSREPRPGPLPSCVGECPLQKEFCPHAETMILIPHPTA